MTIEEIERMLPYYSEKSQNARQLMAKATDEQRRRELHCVAESWEGILEHGRAELELARKRQEAEPA
jgi:hypothetical protein